MVNLYEKVIGLVSMENFFSLEESVEIIKIISEGFVENDIYTMVYNQKVILSIELSLFTKAKHYISRENDRTKNSDDTVNGEVSSGKCLEEQVIDLKRGIYDLPLIEGVAKFVKNKVKSGFNKSVSGNYGGSVLCVEDEYGVILQLLHNYSSELYRRAQDGESHGYIWIDGGWYGPAYSLPSGCKIGLRSENLRKLIEIHFFHNFDYDGKKKEFDSSESEKDNQASDYDKIDLSKVFDETHPWHSIQLAYMIKAWVALFGNRTDSPVGNKPENGQVKNIEKWFRVNMPAELWDPDLSSEPEISKTAITKMAQLTNPDKKRGRSSNG